MMRSSVALLAASALGALAKDTTSIKSLFIGGPSAPGQAYAGSVISVGPSDTTYEIICTATAACGTLSAPQTITIGPSHLNYEFVTTISSIEVSASETCQISGTASAVCQVALSLDVGPTETAITTSTTFTGSQLNGIPITLTGGVEKLPAATGSAASTTSGSSGSASSSAAAASAAIAGSASGSESGASSIMANRRGGDILALVMFSAISVSVGALMIL